MSKWEKIRLEEACILNMGQSPDSASYNEEGEGLPFYQGNADFGDLHPKARYYCSKPAKIAHENDVLISVRAPIGAVNIATEECCIGRGLAALTPLHHLDYKYLYYVIKNKNVELNLKGTGSTFTAINRKSLAETMINFPPLEEQKRIADILDKASNLIDLRKQQLEKMDLLIKSKFIDMFGDPVTNPKEWEVKKIGELTNVFTGATPNKSIDEYYCGNIPWVKTGEISKEYIWEAEERITKKALKETNCKIFPINTIMVAMYGQGKTRGQAGLLKIEASTNQACAAIVPNESYCTEYLFKLIQLSYETLRSLGRGGNQPNLNLSMIKEFLVMCPPVELQNQFAEFVEQVEKQKAVMQQSLEKMETNYKALMQEYFG